MGLRTGDVVAYEPYGPQTIKGAHSIRRVVRRNGVVVRNTIVATTRSLPWAQAIAEALNVSTVHACPPVGSGVTPCCGLTPFEIPRLDRMTLAPDLVTCTAGISGPRAAEQQGGTDHG